MIVVGVVVVVCVVVRVLWRECCVLCVEWFIFEGSGVGEEG